MAYPRPVEDLTGRRFSRLVVVEEAPRLGRRRRVAWRVVCDCGGTAIVSSNMLNRGHTRSCGCLQRERAAELARKKNYRHGMTSTPTHNSWHAMVGRCNVPTSTNYARYGARGVTVCERWLTFENFLADMGERPEGATLDRIDNSKGYKPGNARWATPTQQTRNRRNTRRVVFKGELRPLAEVAEELGVTSARMRERLRYRSFEEVLRIFHSEVCTIGETT